MSTEKTGMPQSDERGKTYLHALLGAMETFLDDETYKVCQRAASSVVALVYGDTEKEAA